MSASGQELRGHLPSILLAVLDREPLYGYRIADETERRCRGLLKVGQGTIYPALYALEGTRLIRGEWRPSESGPRRRYYSLTEKGLKVLERDRAKWAVFAEAVNLILGSPA